MNPVRPSWSRTLKFISDENLWFARIGKVFFFLLFASLKFHRENLNVINVMIPTVFVLNKNLTNTRVPYDLWTRILTVVRLTVSFDLTTLKARDRGQRASSDDGLANFRKQRASRVIIIIDLNALCFRKTSCSAVRAKERGVFDWFDERSTSVRRFQKDEIIAYLDCRWVTTETLMQNSYASSPEYDDAEDDVFEESLTVRILYVYGVCRRCTCLSTEHGGVVSAFGKGRREIWPVWWKRKKNSHRFARRVLPPTVFVQIALISYQKQTRGRGYVRTFLQHVVITTESVDIESRRRTRRIQPDVIRHKIKTTGAATTDVRWYPS